MNPISMSMDVMLALLLVIAIYYCWQLDKRIKALKRGNEGMIAAASELAQTIKQAEQAILGFKEGSVRAGRDLQNKIDEARRLSGTLSGHSLDKRY